MYMFGDDSKSFIDEVKKDTNFKKPFTPYPKKQKKEPTDKPYLPVGIYLDQDIFDLNKDKIISLLNRMTDEGFTIRMTDDPINVYKVIKEEVPNTEIYIPWKGFAEIESPYYFNDDTSKLIAARFMPAYDKVPDAVKAFLARNARLMYGSKNESPVVMFIAGSKDGAIYRRDIKRETGRVSHFLSMANYSKISIFNIGNLKSFETLNKFYFPENKVEV